MIRRIILLALIIICALSIIHAFFMPWARASLDVTKVARGLSESAVSGVLANTPYAGKFIRAFNSATDVIGDMGGIEVKTAVSGYDIPNLANNKTSKVAITLLTVLFNDTKDLDKKSMLVYLLPVFAVICMVLGIISMKSKITLAALIVISGAISIAGLYNLFTVDLSNLMVKITIGQGVWQTMYGFLLMCIIGILWAVLDLIYEKK